MERNYGNPSSASWDDSPYSEKQLAPSYVFRVGMAVGRVRVAQVEAESYSEWSVFGEAVNLAKRITEVAKQRFAEEANALGAVGALVHEPESCGCLEQLLRNSPNSESVPGTVALVEQRDPPDLKGVSPYRGALLIPKEYRPPAFLKGMMAAKTE